MAESHTTAAAEYFDGRADTYRQYFELGLPWDAFVATGKPEHRKRWNELHARVQLTDAQRATTEGITRTMHVLVLAATWCGDCMWQLPALRRVEEASPRLTLRLLDRDSHPELRDTVRLAGAAKTPIALFLSEDFYECSRFGERTLSTYRAISRYFTGPACPVGDIFDDAQLQRTTAEWVDEIERVHLMLRLSPQLRERYGD